jgi:hypothetical protein
LASSIKSSVAKEDRFQSSEFIPEVCQLGDETWSGYRMRMIREEWLAIIGKE